VSSFLTAHQQKRLFSGITGRMIARAVGDNKAMSECHWRKPWVHKDITNKTTNAWIAKHAQQSINTDTE